MSDPKCPGQPNENALRHVRAGAQLVCAIAQLFGIGLPDWAWSIGQTYVAELLPTRVRGTRHRHRRRAEARGRASYRVRAVGS